MSTRIGFLRAVNLGRRKVPMTRLVELVEGLGHDDVWTHVNSGNVIFKARGSSASIEAKIEAALEADLGFEVTTFVRTAAQLRRVVAATPFDVAAGDTWFVTFLKSAPGAAVARQLEGLSNSFDTLVVEGREVHWRMHGRSTESRLRTKDWAVVGTNRSTSRNMTMLRRLVARLEARLDARSGG